VFRRVLRVAPHGRGGHLEGVANIQVANLFNRATDLLLQQVGYLTAKGHVIEKQSSNIMFAFIFDNEIAFGRSLFVRADIYQNSDLVPNDFSLSPGVVALRPDRGQLETP
jgi:hypothetical protein